MLKILIVDDNASYRESLRDLLRQHLPDVVVVEAADGKEALEQIRRTDPALAFIDIELVEESGLDLTRRIREDHGDMPIAIVTSYDLPEYRLAAQECGASCFFSKIASSAQEIFAWIASAAPAVVIA